MTTWTTRDGSTVRIKDMSTEHIANCLRMLRRNAGYIKDRQILQLCFMPGPGGDAATDLFDAEFDALMKEDEQDWIKRQPKYKALRKELRRREGKTA